MSIERQVISGLKWAAIGKVGGQALNWAITIFVVRLLTPADYGLLAMANIVLGLVAMIAEMGLGATVIQARILNDEILRRIYGAAVLLNVAAAAVVVASAPLIAWFFEEPRLTLIVSALSINLLIAIATFVPNAVTYRAMRFKLITSLDLSSSLAGHLLTLMLALMGWGVWALVIGHFGGSVLRAIGLLAVTRAWVRPSFDFRGMRSQLSFGGTLALSRLLWYVFSQVDVAIAGKFLGKQALGVYFIAMHLATLPIQRIMGVVNQVAFPAIARMQEERDRLPARLGKATRLLAYAAFSTLWGIGAVAPEIVTGLLGKQWLNAVVPLQLVSIVLPLRMLDGLISAAVSAVGRADVDLRNNLTSVIVLPIAFLIGVRYGVNGLAAAWAIALPFVFAVNFRRSSATLGLKWRVLGRELRGPLSAGIVMVAAVQGLGMLLDDLLLPIPRLAVLVLTGAAVFVAVTTILDRGIWRELRHLLFPLPQAAIKRGDVT